MGRIASIDILRALTMLLMIWVNDFWTLKEVPKRLQHANATEDYLGFSDVILSITSLLGCQKRSLPQELNAP
mgnify:CR=1 FL=1